MTEPGGSIQEKYQGDAQDFMLPPELVLQRSIDTIESRIVRGI